jgi:hypothetical protein
MSPLSCRAGRCCNGALREMQALDTSTTRLSAVVERLHGVETECKQLASMFRTLETEVPSIADMRAFASKAELAEKANIVDVNEVRVASVDVLLACCISQFQRCSCRCRMLTRGSLAPAGTVAEGEQGHC